MQAISNIVEQIGYNKDINYDVENEMEAIKEYQKHILQDAQQKRVRNFSLDHLNDETCAV